MNADEGIIDFAKRILERDLRAPPFENEWTNNPLPLDRSSSGEAVLIVQLIKAVNPNHFTFLESFKAFSVQNLSIYCASAASGMGKTQMAYSVGSNYCTSIVIRIALPYNDAFNEPKLSSPWSKLVKILENFSSLSGDLESRSPTKRAKICYDYVRLLILCYVQVTLIAVNHNTSEVLSDNEKRQIALRFHRNGRGEALILAYFIEKIKDFTSSEVAIQDFSIINEEKLDAFSVALAEATKDSKILLCFDEIQAIYNIFPKLFLRRSEYTQHEGIVEPNESDIHCSFTPSESDGKRNSTGLFYTICLIMSYLSESHRWCMYMTGTSFKISQFNMSTYKHSLIRYVVKTVTPNVMLTVPNMIGLLQHYWKIDDCEFKDSRVIECLEKCKGRPLFFVEAIFGPLYQRILTCPPKGTLDANYLVKVCKEGIVHMSNIVVSRMRELLGENVKVLSHDKSNTSRSFLPRLLKAYFFNNGELTFEGNDSALEEAISTSIVPVSLQHSNSERIHLNLFDEPLVADAIKTVIDEELRKDTHGITRMCIAEYVASPGIMAELAIAHDFVFRVRQYKLIYTSSNHERAITLKDLILPLFTYNPDYIPGLYEDYLCNAEKIVDCKNYRSDKCVLNLFINEDGSINDTIILINLNTRLGGDIAFVVNHRDDSKDMKLVYFQIKNAANTTLKESLITLHPGTAYLQNDQRKALLEQKRNSKELFQSESWKSSKNEWLNYVKLSRQYPFLTRSWLRIVATSRKISEDIHEYAYEGIYQQTSNWLCLTSKSKKVREDDESYRCSPLVFLNLNSEMWLTNDIRSAFVTKCNDSYMTLTTERNYWIPLSIEQTIKYCKTVSRDLKGRIEAL